MTIFFNAHVPHCLLGCEILLNHLKTEILRFRHGKVDKRWEKQHSNTKYKESSTHGKLGFQQRIELNCNDQEDADNWTCQALKVNVNSLISKYYFLYHTHCRYKELIHSWWQGVVIKLRYSPGLLKCLSWKHHLPNHLSI